MAPYADVHLMPEIHESSIELGQSWKEQPTGAWLSPVREGHDEGSRVAMTAVIRRGAEPQIEARGVNGEEFGPWVPAEITWRLDHDAVLVADLVDRWPAAQLRSTNELAGVQTLGWTLLEPVWEPRLADWQTPPPASSLSATLLSLGVVSRDAWGASSTQCTTGEDDWYRMAIHHTAGNQTYGGTVQGAVQQLQAYSMSGGEYCDIPYQFLVGYDGSLWEGRQLIYLSGATGGNNNPGNIAVCFLGCYDSGGCSSGGDDEPDVMMAWARALVDTLAAEHGVAQDSDTIRGHRDWPDNATACPGDRIYARLDEVRSTGARYEASFVDQDFPTLQEGSLSLTVGTSQSGSISLLNSGTENWEPNVTFLAPTPRDVASPFAASSWPSSTRAATVAGTVRPGEVGTFTFALAGNAEGTATQTFGLVQEWTTWFADLPYGSGPSDSLLAVSVAVGPAVPFDTGTPGDTDDPDDTDDAATDSGELLVAEFSPGNAVPLTEFNGGCGCQTMSPTLGGLASLAAFFGALRRRAARG